MTSVCVPACTNIKHVVWWARMVLKLNQNGSAGFEISLVRSSEMSKNDSQTSGIPAGLVRRTTAYFWFSHKLHWLHIFQTSEWYIRTSDFYNPLAQRTSAFNLKFRSLQWQHWIDSDFVLAHCDIYIGQNINSLVTGPYPVDTWCYNNAIITLKQSCNILT